MWKTLLRLLGLGPRTTGPKTQVPEHPAAGRAIQAPTRPRPGSDGAAGPGASASPTSSSASSVEMAQQVLRRPLLQRDGSLAGFEHFISMPGGAPADSTKPVAPSEEAPQASTAPEAKALLTAMGQTVASGRRALGVVDSRWIADPEVQSLIQPGMMLALADNPFQQPAREPLLQRLRRRGAVLGSTGMPRAGASFVVFDAAGLDRQGLLNRALACATAAPGAQVLATGIRNLDDLEAALHGGFEMVAGLFDRVGLLQESGFLAPDIQRICRLINRVMSDDDTSLVTQEIRADVGLTYRMLRHVNSPLLGLTRRVDSVEQALQLMGRQALYRWLTTLLVASATGRHSSLALQEIALARGRFMEQFSLPANAPSAALFTTGLLSLLDVMMEVPMGKALAPLHLPWEAHAALVRNEGPWWPLIEVARCLESGNTEQAAVHAQCLGGLKAVGPAMTEAWQWAAQVNSSLKQP